MLLGFFSFFRLFVLGYNFAAIDSVTESKINLLLQAFFIGFRFDTVIICSILSLIVLSGGVLYVLNYFKPLFLKLAFLYVSVLSSISFLLCSIDIPFFGYFGRRLNDNLLLWNNAGGMGIKMIFTEPKFYSFLFLFLTVLFLFLLILKKILNEFSNALPDIPRVRFRTSAIPVILIFSLIFIGIRGRIADKSPIIAGSAFFCSYPFLNQLGLNPVYTFSRSMLDHFKPEYKKLHWINDNEAFEIINNTQFGHFKQPISSTSISRMQHSLPKYENSNVVIIIMESLAAHRMKRYGNQWNFTPFLDSLAERSWSFDNTFSSGIHTFNGIYSTLFAHPALMNKHTMDLVSIPKMSGLSNHLAAKGYQTVFFTTHDELFDNMSGFLLANDFKTIIGQKDYPRSEVKSTLGVPDEFMFRFAISRLNKLASNRKPFLATFMTGSNHDPHIIPENTGFIKRNEDKAIAVIEYADWSIQKFMSYASGQSWYANSIFVFVADHGVPLWNDPYEVPFSYHRIPFFIYSPLNRKGESFSKLSLQSDVFPTIMGLVSKDYKNNTLGIDLFTENHPNIVFSSDDVLACMNDSLLFIHRKDRPGSIYKYKNLDKTDYAQSMPIEASLMSKIAFSWLQVSQSIISE